MKSQIHAQNVGKERRIRPFARQDDKIAPPAVGLSEAAAGQLDTADVWPSPILAFPKLHPTLTEVCS